MKKQIHTILKQTVKLNSFVLVTFISLTSSSFVFSQALNSQTTVTDSGEVVTTNNDATFGGGTSAPNITHFTGEFVVKNHQWNMHANTDNSPVITIGSESFPTTLIDSYDNMNVSTGGKFRGLSGNPIIRFVNTNFRQTDNRIQSAFGGNQMEIIVEAYRSNFAFHPTDFVLPFMGILGIFEDVTFIGNNSAAIFLGLPRKMENVLIKNWGQLKIEQGMGAFFENVAFENVGAIFNSGFGNDALVYNAGRTDRILHFLNSSVDKNTVRISNSGGAAIWRSIVSTITDASGNGVSGAKLYMLYNDGGYNLYTENYTRNAAVELHNGALRIVPKDTPDQPGGINTRDWAYLARIGEQWTVSGFTNGANNGTFDVEGRDWSSDKYADHRAFYFTDFSVSAVSEGQKSITFNVDSPQSDANGDFAEYKFSVIEGRAGQNEGNNGLGSPTLPSLASYDRSSWRGVVIPPYPYQIQSNDFNVASFVPAGEKINWLVPGVIDDNITESNKTTVDAYTELDNLEKLYDRAISWKRDNHSSPSYYDELITTHGVLLDFGDRDLIIDASAGSVFDFNTVTNEITIKASALTLGSKFGGIKTTGTITTQNGALLKTGYEDATGTFIYLEMNNLDQQDILITDQQNPGTPNTLLTVSSTTGTYTTHFQLPAGGEINVLAEREGYAPWTETIPAGDLNFVRRVTTSLSAITAENQLKTIDLLIKLLQKTEAVLNTTNTQSLPIPSVSVSITTTTSSGGPTVNNQEAELSILRRILSKLTALREAIR